MGLVSLHQLCYIFVSQKFSFLSDPGFLNVPRGWGGHQFRKFSKILPILFSASLNFCSDFEHFGQDFEVEVQARF